MPTTDTRGWSVTRQTLGHDSAVLSATDPLPFPNLAYALHFYAASHRQPLRDKAERALGMGAALMVTEWGTGGDDGDGPLDHREVTRWLAFLETEQISHINWSLSNRRESAAILMPGVQRLSGWRKDELSESGRLIRRMLRQAAFPRSLLWEAPTMCNWRGWWRC